MGQRLSRQEVSDAVHDLGWRYILGLVRTSARVESLAQAADLAVRFTAAAGDDADGSLWMDVRRDRLILSVQSVADVGVTPREIELVRRISAAAAELGQRLDAGVGGPGPRADQ